MKMSVIGGLNVLYFNKCYDLLTYHSVDILQALPVGIVQDTALCSRVVADMKSVYKVNR